MAEGKKGFIVYTNWNDAIVELSDIQAGQLFKWLLDYCNDKWNDTVVEYPDDVAVKILCKTYQPILKNDLKKYESKVDSINKAREKRKTNIENNIETNIEIKDENSVVSTGVISNKLLVNSNKLLVESNDSIIKDTKVSNIYTIENEPKSVQKEFKLNDAFEYWWNLYPRKIGKQKCRNWFISHKPSRDLVAAMCKTVKLFLDSDWKDCEEQYIPHPYTWLNRGGWDDKPKKPSVKEFTSVNKTEIVFEEL